MQFWENFDPYTFAFVLFLGFTFLMLFYHFTIGILRERSHLKSLTKREAKNSDILLTNLDISKIMQEYRGETPTLVAGEAVFACDCAGNWFFKFRNFFGGRSHAFSRLYERARREATLRMVDKARKAGFNAICNIRYTATDICGSGTSSDSKKTHNFAVCIVSGTAYNK